jgi:hypothetical protein
LCGTFSEDTATENGENYEEMTEINLGDLRVSMLGMYLANKTMWRFLFVYQEQNNFLLP